MSILSLLVFLIVVALIFWAVRAIAAALEIPSPIVQVIYVLLVVLVILYLLQALGLLSGVLSGGPVFKLR